MDLNAENADASDAEFRPRKGEPRHQHYSRVVTHGKVLVRYAKPADRSAYANRLWGEYEKRERMEKDEGKTAKVMREFEAGTLKSSSGQKVTDRSQAIAIGLSEAREAGEDVPAKKKRAAK